MKLLLQVAVLLVFVLVSAVAKDDFLTPDEVEELKRRLAIVRKETLAEVQSIVEVRKKEVSSGTGDDASELNLCVDEASIRLKNGVVHALQTMIGTLEEELNDGRPLDREQFKAKVEAATVGAGAAVEDETMKLIRDVFSCTRQEFARSAKEIVEAASADKQQ